MSQADGQVLVELKLLTEKAEQQMKSFFSKMAGSITSGTGGGGSRKSPADQASDAVDRHVGKLQKLTVTLKSVENAFHNAWKNALPPPVVTIAGSSRGTSAGGYPGGPGSFVGPVKGGGLATAANMLGAAGGQGGGGGGYHGASAAAMAGAGGGGGGGRPNTIAGMASGLLNAPLSGVTQTFVKFTAGLAGLRVVFGLWSWGIQMAIAPLAHLNQLINNMAEGARRVYASSLQSGGMPVGFTSYRQTLARIMGVSEQEVFQFAKQINYLNKQISYSTAISAKHNLVLTESAWKMGVVKNDWKSLMDSLAAAFVGPKNAILDFLHRVINTVTSNMQEVVTISHRLQKAASMSDFMKSHGMQARVVGNQVKWVDASGKENPSLREQFNKQYAASHTMPSPEGSARRYQSSPWERMGLVLGAGIGDNPATKTAYNTTQMLKELQKLNNPNSPLNPKPYRYTKPAGATHP